MCCWFKKELVQEKSRGDITAPYISCQVFFSFIIEDFIFVPLEGVCMKYEVCPSCRVIGALPWKLMPFA